MKIVEEITCYDKNESNKEYFGKMIINPTDSTFEGIIIQKNNAKPNLIFGKVNENYIELIRCPEGDYEFPKRYDCFKNAIDYSGNIFSLTRRKEIENGLGIIKISDPYDYRDITEAEVFTLEDEIYTMKHKLGEEGIRTYQRYGRKGRK